jgi:hypothetical protein
VYYPPTPPPAYYSPPQSYAAVPVNPPLSAKAIAMIAAGGVLTTGGVGMLVGALVVASGGHCSHGGCDLAQGLFAGAIVSGALGISLIVGGVKVDRLISQVTRFGVPRVNVGESNGVGWAFRF